MKDFLSEARILIVDDFPGFRQSLKSMLGILRAKHIDQASNGSECIKLCTEHQYNIIFCDYNMGDGQQVLEELHERSLLQRGTLFLMVTAETSTAQVMGAIEYRPDSYLSKPFTPEQLGQRLKRLIQKNVCLSKIYRALNEGDLDQALLLCDEVMVETPKVRLSCLRIKSELYELQNRYPEALPIFKEVIKEQPLLWALLGLGKLYFNQGDFERAQNIFLKMRESFPQQVTVLDWLAKCKDAQGETEEAEKILLEAISISPKSIRRQATLGAVAATLGHHEIAQKAFHRIIHDGGHSCLLKPQHFQYFFDTTNEFAQQIDGKEKARLLLDSDVVFKKMEHKYHHSPTVMAVSLSSVARLYVDNGQTEKASAMLTKLSRVLTNPDCLLSAEQVEHIEHNLKPFAEDETSQQLLGDMFDSMAEIKGKLVGAMDDSSDKEIFSIQKLDVSLYSETDKLQAAKKINRDGLDLVKENRLQEALDKFRESIRIIPGNSSFLLNAAHIIIENDELNGNAELIEEARTYLNNSMSPDEPLVRRNRYQQLMSKISHV